MFGVCVWGFRHVESEKSSTVRRTQKSSCRGSDKRRGLNLDLRTGQSSPSRLCVQAVNFDRFLVFPLKKKKMCTNQNVAPV